MGIVGLKINCTFNGYATSSCDSLSSIVSKPLSLIHETSCTIIFEKERDNYISNIHGNKLGRQGGHKLPDSYVHKS